MFRKYHINRIYNSAAPDRKAESRFAPLGLPWVIVGRLRCLVARGWGVDMCSYLEKNVC